MGFGGELEKRAYYGLKPGNLRAFRLLNVPTRADVAVEDSPRHAIKELAVITIGCVLAPDQITFKAVQVTVSDRFPSPIQQ